MNKEEAEATVKQLNENGEEEDGVEWVAVLIEVGRQFGFDEWSYIRKRIKT